MKMTIRQIHSTPCGESCRISHLQQRLRGGLSLSHNVLSHPESQEESKNPLQVLCDEGDNDEERVKLLKELKKRHLLLKEDDRMHHFIFYSSHPGAKERFHHLLSICPLSLNAPYNATLSSVNLHI